MQGWRQGWVAEDRVGSGVVEGHRGSERGWKRQEPAVLGRRLRSLSPTQGKASSSADKWREWGLQTNSGEERSVSIRRLLN